MKAYGFLLNTTGSLRTGVCVREDGQVLGYWTSSDLGHLETYLKAHADREGHEYEFSLQPPEWFQEKMRAQVEKGDEPATAKPPREFWIEESWVGVARMMPVKPKVKFTRVIDGDDYDKLAAENAELKARLEEANESLSEGTQGNVIDAENIKEKCREFLSSQKAEGAENE